MVAFNAPYNVLGNPYWGGIGKKMHNLDTAAGGELGEIGGTLDAYSHPNGSLF